MSTNWKVVKEDLEWSLNKGDDVKGRDALKEAFAKGEAKYIDAAGQAYKWDSVTGTSRLISHDVRTKILTASITWAES